MQLYRFIDNSNQFNMFRASILPTFRSIRLCVTACGIKHQRCCRPVAWKWRQCLHFRLPATSWVHYTTSCNTQSNAPEGGRNNRRKHVELTGIFNKPLLLHLDGCLYYLYNDALTYLLTYSMEQSPS